MEMLHFFTHRFPKRSGRSWRRSSGFRSPADQSCCSRSRTRCCPGRRRNVCRWKNRVTRTPTRYSKSGWHHIRSIDLLYSLRHRGKRIQEQGQRGGQGGQRPEELGGQQLHSLERSHLGKDQRRVENIYFCYPLYLIVSVLHDIGRRPRRMRTRACASVHILEWQTMFFFVFPVAK